MNLPEYTIYELYNLRADELARAAARRRTIAQLCPPVLRQRFACFLGRHCMQLGYRLLAYGRIEHVPQENKSLHQA